MPPRRSKRSKKADIDQPEENDALRLSFEVEEWLEGERLEHERRMLELGLPSNPTKKQSNIRKKQNSS